MFILHRETSRLASEEEEKREKETEGEEKETVVENEVYSHSGIRYSKV